jgi:virulence factor Mce-like protein
MKRTISVVVLLAVVVLVGILLVGSGSGSDYRVAAVFDTADGMVAGQQVKIAGAVVGSVKSVELAPGPKARIVMSIQSRFAPFRTSASCTILPEGLISENFVQCTPGRSGAALASAAGGVPTVPLSHTTIPFSLQDVLNVLSLPTDERVQVLISELGIGAAGEGGNINSLLARTNPALEKSQQVLKIVDAQRAQLGTAVDQSEQVLASVANRGPQLRQFVDRAAAVTQETADHRDALGQSVARLPAMLSAVRPGLRSLNQAAVHLTPLLSDLRTAAPQLTRLTSTLPAFARAGMPAVRTVSAAAAAGRPAVHAAVPVVDHLLKVTGPLQTVASSLSQLLVSSRQTGAFEGVEAVIYSLANISSLYDNVSHILSFTVNVAPQCIIGEQAGIQVPGCDHNYTASGQGTVPINEPSCGPQANVAWLQDHCTPVAPGLISLKRDAGTTVASEATALQSALRTGLSGKTVPRQTWLNLARSVLK